MDERQHCFGTGDGGGVAVALDAGRSRLIDGILSRIHTARTPDLLGLRGDAGQGKSTLLCALKSGAQEHGYTVLSVRGHACSARLPYAGLLDLITSDPARPASGLVDRLTSFTAATSPLAVAYAVESWFRDLGLRDRLVVLVDDADLLDEDSLRVLAYAVTRLAGSRTAVVHALTRRVALLERLNVAPVRLDDLPRGDAVSCAVTAGAARHHAEHLVDRLGGNPLALVHAAPDFGIDAVGPMPTDVPVAARLAHDVDSRMEPLASDDRRLLEAAALAGEDRLEHLLSVCVGPTGAVPDVLDRLEASGLANSNGQRLRWRRPWMAVAVRHRCGAARRIRVVDQLRQAMPTDRSGKSGPPRSAQGGRLSETLTASERRVVDVIVTGASVKQAAEQLCLSDRTVGTHLQSAYRKLGVRSRGQLAALLLASS